MFQIGGCQSQLAEPHNDAEAHPWPWEPALPGVVFDDAGAPDRVPSDFEIHYRSSGCLGPCPAATISLFANGSGEYSGTYCVADQGPVALMATPQTMTDLAERLGALRFFELQERFDAAVEGHEEVSDVQWCALRVVVAGQSATLNDDAGFVGSRPPWRSALTELEEAIVVGAGAEDLIGEVQAGDPTCNFF